MPLSRAALAARGKGSLAGSVVTHDPDVARSVVLGLAPWHGRILVLDRDDAAHPRPTRLHFSHVTTQRYLPAPAGAPPWPFSEIGQWMIDANPHADDWIEGLRQWRREHLVRLGWDDAAYRRPELQWAQRNLVNVQTMIEDRYLFDPASGRYQADATPSTGTDTLADFYRDLVSGKVSIDRGDHAVF